MTGDIFSQIFAQQMAYCEHLLINKASEYASDDRLSAFKDAAVIQETTPRKALAGMMAKHTHSVYKFCRSDELIPAEQWIEKITDHINYLVLLRALVEEEAQQWT